MVWKEKSAEQDWWQRGCLADFSSIDHAELVGREMWSLQQGAEVKAKKKEDQGRAEGERCRRTAVSFKGRRRMFPDEFELSSSAAKKEMKKIHMHIRSPASWLLQQTLFSGLCH
uniref:Uncharacterized protein n=1 Tax=Ficedula albicollis TaxID=59894 RepID=A0A803VX45_FICAL